MINKDDYFKNTTDQFLCVDSMSINKCSKETSYHVQSDLVKQNNIFWRESKKSSVLFKEIYIYKFIFPDKLHL